MEDWWVWPDGKGEGLTGGCGQMERGGADVAMEITYCNAGSSVL